MQFFSQGRIWNTGHSKLIATSNWREHHIDTIPDWQRNHYYRTKDGKYFCVTEVKKEPGFFASLFGAQPSSEFR
jgi:5'(3')-deoxyribonucleotidase